MKNPLRMCIVNREMLPKSELVRLVKVNGKIMIDKKNNIQTRGVWICRSSECIAKLKKTKCLNRAFKCDVPEEVYKEIEEYLVNGLK